MFREIAAHADGLQPGAAGAFNECLRAAFAELCPWTVPVHVLRAGCRPSAEWGCYLVGKRNADLPLRPRLLQHAPDAADTVGGHAGMATIAEHLEQWKDTGRWRYIPFAPASLCSGLPANTRTGTYVGTFVGSVVGICCPFTPAPRIRKRRARRAVK